MSIQHGSTTTVQYRLKGKIKDHFLSGLAGGQFVPRELDYDESAVGFCVFGNELSTEFSELNTVYGKFFTFSFRIDTLRKPTKEVDLMLQSRITERLQETEAIGKRQRDEMKEDILLELKDTVRPDIKIVQCVFDKASKVLYAETTSAPVMYQLENSIRLHLGDFELVDYLSHALKLKEYAEDITKSFGFDLFPEVEVVPGFEMDPLSTFTSSFLTWLFYKAETTDGVVDGDLSFFLEDPFTLSGEKVGSQSVTIKKGHVNRCTEIAAALKSGKRIKKAKITLSRDGMEDPDVWHGTIGGDCGALASMRLPTQDAPDAFGRQLGRFFTIEEAHEVIHSLVHHYVETRYDPTKWPKEVVSMKQWIEDIAGGDNG